MDYEEVSRLWDQSVRHWEAGNFQDAYCCLDGIADPPAAIIFNAAVLEMIFEEYEDAYENFSYTLEQDSGLAAAYYLRGIAACRLHRFADACSDFKAALGCMDGHKYIDYKPLGMKLLLCEFQILANISMVSASLDSDLVYAEELMVRAKIKEDVLRNDRSIQGELDEQPLPFFDDICEECRQGNCPLAEPCPLPYFRNDGLLLSMIKHRQEQELTYDVCSVDNDDKCSEEPPTCVLPRKPENGGSKVKALLQRKAKKVKCRSHVPFLRRSSKLENSVKSSTLERSYSPAPVPDGKAGSPASLNTFENDVVRRVSPISHTEEDHERRGSSSGPSRRMSASFAPTGDLRAQKLISTSRPSLTDFGEDRSCSPAPHQSRRISMTRRRSRSAAPSELCNYDSDGTENSGRRSSSGISRPMSLMFTRERCGSLPNMAAMIGREPPMGSVTSPLCHPRHPVKVDSPLARSGSAIQFSFPSPSPIQQTPGMHIQSSRIVQSEPARRPIHAISHLGRAPSFHCTLPPSDSPESDDRTKEDSGTESFDGDWQSPCDEAAVDEDPAHPINKDTTDHSRTTTDADGRKSSEVGVNHKYSQDSSLEESSGECILQPLTLDLSSEHKGMTLLTDDSLDCDGKLEVGPVSPRSVSPMAASTTSELSGMASDGSSVAEIDFSSPVVRKEPTVTNKVSCSMDDVLKKISSLGRMQSCTVNIIINGNM